jgi:hypothetical protein
VITRVITRASARSIFTMAEPAQGVAISARVTVAKPRVPFRITPIHESARNDLTAGVEYFLTHGGRSMMMREGRLIGVDMPLRELKGADF